MPVDKERAMSDGQLDGMFISVKSRDEAQEALKGWTKSPSEMLDWGSDNLGIGLLLARRSRKLLNTADSKSPTTSFIASGRHILR